MTEKEYIKEQTKKITLILIYVGLIILLFTGIYHRSHAIQSLDDQISVLDYKSASALKTNTIEQELLTQEYIDNQFNLTINILETTVYDKDNSCLQVKAQAFQNGKQLGFGINKNIDQQRFIICNPPILIDDPGGTIIRTSFDKKGRPIIRHLTLNPSQALKNALARIISLTGSISDSIIKGSQGNTDVSIFTNTNGDGAAYNNAVFATARASATGVAEPAVSLESLGWYNAGSTLYRGFFPIAITGLSGETVASSTFSYYGNAPTGSPTFGLILTTQASATNLISGDYSALTLNSPTEGATRITPSGAGYQHFTLNANGLSWIIDGTNLLLGVREAHDIDNSAPGAEFYQDMYYADQTGTDKDPFIVITLTATGGGTPATSTSSFDYLNFPSVRYFYFFVIFMSFLVYFGAEIIYNITH